MTSSSGLRERAVLLPVLAVALALSSCAADDAPRADHAASTTAPAPTSGPALPEGRYKTLKVTETSGHDRTGWPVVTGVTVPATSDVKALVLVAETGPHAGKRLPLQVLASLDAKYPADAPAENRPSKQREIRLVEVCFLADLPAGETVTFRLYHDGPATRAEESERLETIATRDAITYSDDRLAGNTIDTGPARFTLHGPS